MGVIEAGVVLPSVILRKLAAAGSSNALSRALRVVHCQNLIHLRIRSFGDYRIS
jgi:hypothetical protein